ncbi:hypothetical protein Taro_023638 [Colocasia esculenta]|uniref:C2 domain-containing protein n=1 Tax=Colocasia esculenta TaxID=4460 RepID=A0A843VF33_COLES|nr:hypothetical protein [Colocasia esculenta]
MGEKTMKMEQLLGLLRVRVDRGINLAVRDIFSSDPYVVFRMGKQKRKGAREGRNQGKLDGVECGFRERERERREMIKMEHVLGLLKVRVIRGDNLVKRDLRASDPYVLVTQGEQKLKTRVVRNNVNPVWNEELTLCILDPTLAVKLVVLDKDTFGSDDPMGHAEFDIQPLVEVVKMHVEGAPNNTVIKKITPSRSNCLADESKIYISDGKVVQDLILRLKDVESGEVELQLQWSLDVLFGHPRLPAAYARADSAVFFCTVGAAAASAPASTPDSATCNDLLRPANSGQSGS